MHLDLTAAVMLHCNAERRLYVSAGGPLTVPEAEKWLRDVVENDNTKAFAIVHLATDRTVGFIVFEDLRASRHNATVTIGLTELAGVGVGMEACLLGGQYIFHREGVHRVTAPVIAGNLLSERLMMRLGFRVEGRVREAAWVAGQYRDLMMYGLLRREATWLPSRYEGV